MTDKTAIEKARDALVLARDYINDGTMLPKDIDHPYFKTSAAIDEALAELYKCVSKEAEPDNHATDEAWWVARKVYDGIKADLSPFASACLIKQFAESYHASRCKEESAAILAASNRLGAALDESDKV